MIEREFYLRYIEDSSKFYLERDVTSRNDGIHISCKRYIEEALRGYQEQHGTLKKQNCSMQVDIQLELNNTDILNDKEHKRYQKILGIAQWIVTSDRLIYAILLLP